MTKVNIFSSLEQFILLRFNLESMIKLYFLYRLFCEGIKPVGLKFLQLYPCIWDIILLLLYRILILIS